MWQICRLPLMEHLCQWQMSCLVISYPSTSSITFCCGSIRGYRYERTGNIAFSRDSVGQMVEVREHQFLIATSNLDYNFTFVQGAANILFSRTGLFIDQFTCRGGEGMLLLHGYGNVFEKMLAPGETLDVEPGAWLWKDPSVQMTVTTVAGSAWRWHSRCHRRSRCGRLDCTQPLHRTRSSGHPIYELSSAAGRGCSTSWWDEQRSRNAGSVIRQSILANHSKSW
jgi:Mitochondrial biogenesis AIM24